MVHNQPVMYVFLCVLRSVQLSKSLCVCVCIVLLWFRESDPPSFIINEDVRAHVIHSPVLLYTLNLSLL